MSNDELLDLIAAAFDPDGCACIDDMPGDNYTCSAHQELRRIARERIKEKKGC